MVSDRFVHRANPAISSDRQPIGSMDDRERIAVPEPGTEHVDLVEAHHPARLRANAEGPDGAIAVRAPRVVDYSRVGRRRRVDDLDEEHERLAGELAAAASVP